MKSAKTLLSLSMEPNWIIFSANSVGLYLSSSHCVRPLCWQEFPSTFRRKVRTIQPALRNVNTRSRFPQIKPTAPNSDPDSGGTEEMVDGYKATRTSQVLTLIRRATTEVDIRKAKSWEGPAGRTLMRL